MRNVASTIENTNGVTIWNLRHTIKEQLEPTTKLASLTKARMTQFHELRYGDLEAQARMDMIERLAREELTLRHDVHYPEDAPDCLKCWPTA